MKENKIPWHVRQFVKQELMDYQKNIKLLSDYKGSTRGLLIAERRVKQIQEGLKQLDAEEMEVVKIIFFDKKTQAQAEIDNYITKAQYYYAMNKAIFLCAVTMDML